MVKILYKFADKGFTVFIDGKQFSVRYPDDVWESFQPRMKKVVAENYIFLATCFIPLSTGLPVSYKMNSPLLRSFFVSPLLNYIPFVSDQQNVSSMSMLRPLFNSKFDFSSYEITLPLYKGRANERAVTLFTFGKDSLLTYAVAQEIGLDPVPMFIEEPDIQYESNGQEEQMYEVKHKNALIKQFYDEFGIDVLRLRNHMGLLRYPETLEVECPDYGWSSQLTEYALLALPFTQKFKAKYVLYGNEASCSQKYATHEDILVNPVFDQSASWMVEINKMLHLITDKITALSLIEPLHDLAIMRILHHRYPDYAKYQMSCFADNNEAKNSRWCHSCSKCARIYAFCKAINVDPKNIGFKEDMFSKKKMDHFQFFMSPNKSSQDKNIKGYDFSGLGHDEMLLSFLLAHRNGSKGYAIQVFKRKFLKEALEREAELKKKFLTVQPSITIPKKLRKKIISLYKEELANWGV